MSRTLSKTVSQEVDFEIELSVEEVVEFLEEEGYSVEINSGPMTRDIARKQLQGINDCFGGTIIDTDYYHGTELKIPPGSTVLIVPGL